MGYTRRLRRETEGEGEGKKEVGREGKVGEGGEKGGWGLAWAFETSNPAPSDTLSLASPPNPQHLYSLVTMNSNRWAYGAFSSIPMQPLKALLITNSQGC